MKKIFLAHGKGLDNTAVDALKSECLVAAQAYYGAGAHPIVVVSGVSDWEERFASCGGWEGWERSVAQESGPFGDPLFDVIVIPFVKGGQVGKATGQIAAYAEQVGKPVLALYGARLHGIDDIQIAQQGFNPVYQMIIRSIGPQI